MSKLATLLFLLISSSFCAQQSTEIVTLKGDQFKLGCDDWFPLAVNYGFVVLRDDQGNFFPSRDPHVGPDDMDPTNDHECQSEPDCFQLLVDDFSYLSSLGFNSIRLVGQGYGIARYWNQSEWETVSSTEPVFVSNDYSNSGLTVQIHPFSEMGMTEKFLEVIAKVLDAADLAQPNPIKVQLLTGNKDLHLSEINTGYKDYLEKLAIRFKENSTLYSLDFYNEPTDNGAHELSKAQVCKLVQGWNSAIKSNSNIQLTTVGLLGPGGIINSWDPGIMKVDFISTHLYDKRIDADAEKVKANMKWFSETCPLPWILGEIGYTADPAGNSGQGSLDQQADFAKETLEFARDCGASGYQWWWYEDNFFTAESDPNYFLSFYGILDANGVPKPIVEVFEQFDPFDFGECGTPDNYFNTTEQEGFTLTGVVKKGLISDGIKNAVISGHQVNGNDWDFANSTFSDDFGFYELNSEIQINKLTISAVAANFVQFDVTSNSNLTILSQSTHQTGVYLNNMNIGIGNSYNDESYDVIEVSNYEISGNGVIGGSSTLQGKEKVILKTGFHSHKGSYFKAHNAPLYFACDESQFKNLLGDEKLENQLEPIISVFPNPTNEYFEIRSAVNLKEIQIMNAVGQSMIHWKKLDIAEIKINTSEFSSGLYYIRYLTEDNMNGLEKLIVCN